MSYVTDISAAPADVVIDHLSMRLSVETDCWDVCASMEKGQQDFVLLHVVGSAEVFARRHIPGAIHLRHADMTEERMQEWPKDTLFVVYCAGLHITIVRFARNLNLNS